MIFELREFNSVVGPCCCNDPLLKLSVGQSVALCAVIVFVCFWLSSVLKLRVIMYHN